jgi:hypothetical protein
MWISKVSNCEMKALIAKVGTHSLRGDIFKHIQYNAMQYTFCGSLGLSQDNRMWNMS